MDLNIQSMLFQFFGGLGLFLFGITLMGEGLKRSAGDRLRDLLQRFTSTPLKAILTGIAVTCLIQSSSGTTVLAVGLVSSGFMTLEQAIGVVMGANVGTTVTSFIIGINIGDYALPIIGIGSVMMFFFKNPVMTHLGNVIVGFGMLFYGLDLMGTGMEPLQQVEAFHLLMSSLSHNPLLGAAVGLVLTVVMQSSSATIGIMQQLYMQGNITLAAVLPILFGDNIGTTITAMIAALGGTIAAKRTAGAHVFFNVVGTVIFLIFLKPFTAVILTLSGALNLNPAMQIAFAHGIFNVANLLIQCWFIPQIAALMRKIIPESEEIEDVFGENNLDVTVLKQAGPTLALHQAHKELVLLAKLVQEMFHDVKAYYYSKDEELGERVLEIEEYVNQADSLLTDYLGLIAEYELGVSDSEVLTAMINASKYLERTGDHTVLIANSLTEAIAIEKTRQAQGKDKTTGRKMQWGDPKLERMFALATENIDDMTYLIETGDTSVVPMMMEREDEVNELQDLLRTRYISLIRNGYSRPVDNILFIDIVASVERITDHTIRLINHHLNSLHHYSPAELMAEAEAAESEKELATKQAATKRQPVRSRTR